MGMKVMIEVEVDYPDLSMQKHIDMLKAIFEHNKVYGVKIVKMISYSGKPVYGEQIYPRRCIYCKGTGNENIEGRGSDCSYCDGSGIKPCKP